MMLPTRRWFLILVSLLPILAQANLDVSQTMPLPDMWQFTLPTLDDSRFVKSATLPGPLLVNFWGSDCPACVAELPRLALFAQAHPNWTMLLVSTDPPAQAREFATRNHLRLPILRSGSNVLGLMRRAGNTIGVLPFTVLVVDQRVCGRQLGALTDQDLRDLTSHCLQSPHPDTIR